MRHASPLVRVAPETVSAGDAVVLRFAEPIRGAALPNVTIGGKPLDAAALCDAHTIIGCVPDGRPGRKEVRVDGLSRASVKTSSPLRHEGRRPAAKGGDPLHGIMHFNRWVRTPHVRPPRLTLNPGSSWYMLGANVSHDANGRVPMTVPLATAWTRNGPTPYTFWYAESILCDNAPAPGVTTLFLAPATSSGQGETLAAVDASTGATLWTWTVSSGRSRI